MGPVVRIPSFVPETREFLISSDGNVGHRRARERAAEATRALDDPATDADGTRYLTTTNDPADHWAVPVVGTVE
jgi:hypothetical protein